MTSSHRLHKNTNSEWSYFVRVDSVPSSGKSLKISANVEERAAVASRLGLLSLDRLDAELHLTPKNSGHILEVDGTLDADLVQSCVVTLEPVGSHIEDSFSAWFADYDQAASFTKAQHDQKARFEGEEQPIMEEEDDPEPMTGGEVNLGELVIQYLSLAIDPYPKSDSAKKQEEKEPEEAQPKGALQLNPFAALKNWRPKD